MTGVVRVCGAESIDHVVTDAPLPAAVPLGRRRGRDRGDASHEDRRSLGGGGFRVPLVYGALLAPARAARARRGRALRRRRRRGSTASRRVLDGLAARARRRGCRSAPTTRPRRRASRAPTSSSARSASASSRAASSTSDVPLGAGVLGQETTGPGRHLLRAAHDPGDGASSPRRSPSTRPARGSINFTNPAGLVTEAIQQVLGDRVVGICDSPSGLCRRVAAALGRDAGRAVVRLLRPQPPRLAARRARRRRATCCPSLLADDERLATLRGGPPVRRRVAALARDDPERVPLLLLLTRPTRSARSATARASRGAVPARAAGARSTPANGRTPEEALAAWRATRRERERTYIAEARSAAGDAAEHDDVGGRRRLRGRGDGGRRGDRAQRARAVLILNTANRTSLPFLDERAVVEVPCVVGRAGAVPIAVGDVPGARAGADRDDQGRRAHDDRARR